MAKLLLAALLIALTGCAHGPRVHVICPGEPFEFAMKAGDSVVYDPPTCRFPLESYYNGPLLFK